MEKAIYLSDIKKLSDTDLSGYQRLYFGAEFCEHLIPKVEELKQAYDFAKQAGLSFTLVTPYVTARGLEFAEPLFEALSAFGDENTEVVVNDYGILSMLRERPNSLKPVLGRLLTRQRRGWGLYGSKREIPDKLIKAYQNTAVEVDIVVDFLNSMGVNRVEIDNLLHGVASDFTNINLDASVYYPYGLITTARYCSWAFDGKKWLNITGSCPRTCRGNLLVADHDFFEAKIYMRGNTQFYKKDDLDGLESKGIDRFIFEPEPPY